MPPANIHIDKRNKEWHLLAEIKAKGLSLDRYKRMNHLYIACKNDSGKLTLRCSRTGCKSTGSRCLYKGYLIVPNIYCLLPNEII